jgi:hypothetical protein
MISSSAKLGMASAALGLLIALPVHAGTIVSVTGPVNAGFELGETIGTVIEVSFTITGTTYQNVNVSAVVGSTATTNPSITAYLTTQIGSGATSATEVAPPSTITPGAGPQNDTFFSGLTLGPGTYYLVLTGAANPSVQSWKATTTPTVTTDTGVTLGSIGDANNGTPTPVGVPDGAYPPGSTFGAPTSTATVLFSVTGNPVSSTPEPTSMLLAAFGFLGIGGRILWPKLRRGTRLS